MPPPSARTSVGTETFPNSIFLSFISKLTVLILVVVPLTVRLPEILTFPVTSKVSCGEVLKIPTLLVADLIVIASYSVDPYSVVILKSCPLRLLKI